MWPKALTNCIKKRHVKGKNQIKFFLKNKQTEGLTKWNTTSGRKLLNLIFSRPFYNLKKSHHFSKNRSYATKRPSVQTIWKLKLRLTVMDKQTKKSLKKMKLTLKNRYLEGPGKVLFLVLLVLQWDIAFYNLLLCQAKVHS